MRGPPGPGGMMGRSGPVVSSLSQPKRKHGADLTAASAAPPAFWVDADRAIQEAHVRPCCPPRQRLPERRFDRRNATPLGVLRASVLFSGTEDLLFFRGLRATVEHVRGRITPVTEIEIERA